MIEDIHDYFAIRTPEIELCVDLIVGIYEERRTSSTALASHVRGEALLASKERRIERFYKNGPVDSQQLLRAVIKMFGKQKIKLSLDRTNWEFGKHNINALAAFASGSKIGSLVNLKMLDNNGGNSKSSDRIAMVKEVVEGFGKDNIENILGDREFCSVDFVGWLIEEELPFTLRVRENLNVVQPYLKRIPFMGKTFKNILFYEDDKTILYCDLSVKKLKGEYLILVSKYVKTPLKDYRERWVIERYFRMLKTGGLNIESTKIIDIKRLEILFLLCSMAYLICVKVGVYRHRNIQKMRWKRQDRCFEFSFFRWGLDWLKELIQTKINDLQAILSPIFPRPQC